MSEAPYQTHLNTKSLWLMLSESVCLNSVHGRLWLQWQPSPISIFPLLSPGFHAVAHLTAQAKLLLKWLSSLILLASLPATKRRMNHCGPLSFACLLACFGVFCLFVGGGFPPPAYRARSIFNLSTFFSLGYCYTPPLFKLHHFRDRKTRNATANQGTERPEVTMS